VAATARALFAVPPPPFDWKHPEYGPIFLERADRLEKLRAEKVSPFPALRAFYRENPGQFINDWGMTVDPRNVERRLPTLIPFLLFPRQFEFVAWVMERWRSAEPGIGEKSRDSGLSWLIVGLGCTLCLLMDGVVIGYGSRKQEYVDDIGNPKALFWKARAFMQYVPPEFRGTWNAARHAPHMRILFPDTGSAMTGESGDGIGRGDRTSLYFVDESAFLERPTLVDASLSNTTNCRIDISTPNGLGNSFAQRRFSGKIKVFPFHWRDDPRKGDDWYAKQKRDLDEVTIASEIDINYSGSIEGQLIPAAWIDAAVGAHLKLGIQPTGTKRAGFDVADEGKDKNSMCFSHGFLIERMHTWSGKSSDIYASVVKAIALCAELGYEQFDYDADGLGSGVRGDARKINEDRSKVGLPVVRDHPFRGSGAVFDPEGEMVKKRKNKDFFANAKAQSWWHLRLLFQNTYRAVVEGLPYDPDKIISIDPNLEELLPLRMELAQPTYSLNTVGKVVVDKQPDGVLSPNRADGVMIARNPGTRGLDVWAKLGK
jgi:phage terminase large subunit